MNARKITLCAFLTLAFFIGMNISGGISKVFAVECYCPGPCYTDCISDPDPGYSKSECRQVYNRAIRNDTAGIGLISSQMPCGKMWVGQALCDIEAGACGGASYKNGACI